MKQIQSESSSSRGRGKPKMKPINPFIASWLREHGYDNIKQAARECGIPQSTLYEWADISKSHSLFASILDISEKMKLSPDALMRGVLEGKQQTAAR